MDAIVLAAGKGTRMGPLCTRRPKPLLPVAGRPLLIRLLDDLEAVGAKRIFVVVHHQADQVQAAVAAWNGSAQTVCVEQGEPRGTGHAVAAAVAAGADKDALLVMGDCLVSKDDLAGLAAADGFVLGAVRVDDPTKYGALDVDGPRVLGLAEKSPNPPSDLINTGLYRVPASALAATAHLKPSPRGELEFTDVVNHWASRGDLHWTPAESWRDVGTPWDYLAVHEESLGDEADRLLGQNRHGGPGMIEEGVHVRGRLWVGEGAVVRSGVYVEGDVIVGAGAKVGPNAYLRGPIAIGAGCHVGAAVEIKNSILLDRANTPHLNYVGDSILCSGVNLGAGTKVANLKVKPGTIKVDWNGERRDTGRRKFGVIIGDDVKTGINCSLNPGTILGAGVLVGAGKVVTGWIDAGASIL